MPTRITSLFVILFVSVCLFSDSLGDDKAKAMRHGRMTKMVCAGCHGTGGEGVERNGVLVAPGYGDSLILQHDPELLALIILKGIEAGEADYPGLMVGLEQVYDDHDLAAVMTYVRNKWGGHDDHIRDEQAAAWRAKHAGRTAPVTQEELEEARSSTVAD